MILRPRLLLPALLLLAGAASALRAQDVNVFTLDLPFGANEATPAWLGHPVMPTTTFATLDLPVMPPEAGASLLVTVFFQEKNGGFLRIMWQGGAGTASDDTNTLPGPGEAAQSSVLCDNFYEGIGMSNQRSLLIPADTMKQAGQLVFQCGDSALGISRIRLEWLQSSAGLSSPAITDTLVTPADGRTQFAADLTGQPPPAPDAAWNGRIVNVPLTGVPMRIEQGVDFTVQMDAAPTLARIALKETGLPWGEHLVVWLNNQHAGVILPSVPALGDAGYPDDKGSAYVGWREGSFYVPAGLLAAGNDTLEFSAESDLTPGTAGDAAAPAPLALKDVVLQLDYPVNSTASARIAPAPAESGLSAPGASDAAASALDSTPASAPASTPAPDSSGDAPVTPAPNPDPSSTPAPNLQNPGLLSLPVSTPSSTTP